MSYTTRLTTRINLPLFLVPVDCDIVLPLSHVSIDLKFNQQDNFIIRFVEETQEWSIDAVRQDNEHGGTFKSGSHSNASVAATMRESSSHLTVPNFGGWFTYALPAFLDPKLQHKQRGAVLTPLSLPVPKFPV
jgi:hypothetical protein